MSNGFPTIAPTGSPTVPLVPPPSSPSPIPFPDAQVDAFREQDRCLPIANVARMMKTSLPAHAKVSKEAKECVQECVSEFISFITSEGADKCLQEKRKTINGEDILSALRSLGFDNYEGVLTVYLAKLREYQMAFARSRQHIGGDELNEELSDGEDAIEGKRKWKRNGEGVEPKRLKDEEGIYTG